MNMWSQWKLFHWIHLYCVSCLQCFDTVGWVAGRTSGLWKTEWWDVGIVICLGPGADLYMAQLMSLPLTVSCSVKSRLVLLFWYQLTQAHTHTHTHAHTHTQLFYGCLDFVRDNPGELVPEKKTCTHSHLFRLSIIPWWSTFNFLFDFNRNYASILYCFRVITNYFVKSRLT